MIFTSVGERVVSWHVLRYSGSQTIKHGRLFADSIRAVVSVSRVVLEWRHTMTGLIKLIWGKA